MLHAEFSTSWLCILLAKLCHKYHVNLRRNSELFLQTWVQGRFLLLYSFTAGGRVKPSFNLKNRLHTHLVIQTNSHTVSCNSREQPEHGNPAEMFEKIQEGKRCYPGWAGLPWLPPGQHAPQIASQETAGRMRRIPTPCCPSSAHSDSWGRSFAQNILSSSKHFCFFNLGC